jgi:hypothetical protein
VYVQKEERMIVLRVGRDKDSLFVLDCFVPRNDASGGDGVHRKRRGNDASGEGSLLITQAISLPSSLGGVQR